VSRVADGRDSSGYLFSSLIISLFLEMLSRSSLYETNKQLPLQASLFEASEREGADSIIKAHSPSQQGDAWRCTC